MYAINISVTDAMLVLLDKPDVIFYMIDIVLVSYSLFWLFDTGNNVYIDSLVA